MASLEQGVTGLPFVVWISQSGDFGHDVRIWLSRSPKAAPSEMVVVAIRPKWGIYLTQVTPRCSMAFCGGLPVIGDN